MFNKEKIKKLLNEIVFEIVEEKSKGQIIGEIIKELYQDPDIKQHISSEEIEKIIRKYLWDNIVVKSKDEYLKQIIDELEQEFNSISNWWVLVPVLNLKISDKRTLKIGKVNFFLFNEYRKKQYKRYIKTTFDKNVNYNQKQKKELYKAYIQRIIPYLDKKLCASIYEEGTYNMAILNGYEKIRTSLAILKLYYSPEDDYLRSNFNLTGEIITPQIRHTFIYRDDWSESNINLEKVGYFIEHLIDKKKLIMMKKLEFNNINKILLKSNENEVESTIINAIRIFGEACDVEISTTKEDNKSTYNSISMNDRLIKLFIALESFLIFDQYEPINNNIAERCAFILSNKYEERKKIKKYVKNMYKYRSSHVHHGKSNLDKMELDQFILLVQACIIKTIKLIHDHKLTTTENLQEWFEKVKLS